MRNERSKLVKALSAGAVIMSRPNIVEGIGPETQIKADYQKLKAMLAASYPQVDVHMLDIAPGSEARQETIAQQLEASGAAEDADILQQARVLLDIIKEEDPSAVWATAVAEPPAHLK